MQPARKTHVFGSNNNFVMAQRKIDAQADLIDRLRKQDRGAQFEVYKQYSKAMLNTAHRILQNLEEAEDVLQESFLSAFVKIDQFGGASTLGAWLKRITVNKAINALQRNKASWVPLDEAIPERLVMAEQDNEISALWNIEQVMHVIATLPEGYRVVFSLYLLEGYDHLEIAEILGISEGTSKSQYNRAKQKVREILTAQSYV
jgi:RNA polymerase sigma factor (sigma-70 family)